VEFTLKDLMNHLAQSIHERRLCFFLGAGISKNPPANMPLAKDLRLSIMRKLLDKKEFGWNLKKKLLNYPFEAFLQVVSGDSEILESMIRIFRHGKPNKNHMFVAKLMKRGYVRNVLTTNFDLLLERALEHEGLRRDTHFRVFFDEKQFSRLDFRRPAIPTIFKIHGSADDVNSIRTTLELIAHETLSKSRATVLGHFFSDDHTIILIMGYSAKDEFDVNPILRGMKTRKQVIFVKHNKKEIDISELGTPFEGFNGVNLKYDTDKLVDNLWSIFIKTEWEQEESLPIWEKQIAQWGQNLSHGLRYFSLGKILREVGETDQAEFSFKSALRAFKEHKDERGISLTLHNLAVIKHEQGYYDSAMKLCEKSLEIKGKLNDLTGIAETLHQQAIIRQDQGQYENAIELYKKSLKIERELNDQIRIASSLNNLATIFEKQSSYRKAVSLYKRSLTIENRVGDLRGAATTMHNLAVAHQNMGKWNLSLRFYGRSLEIRERLFDQSGIASSLHQLGTMYQLCGNLDKAEKLYRQSARIRMRLKDNAGIAESLHQLATIFYDRRQLNRALKFYGKSLKIEKKLGNRIGIARTAHNLAMIHCDRGDYDYAMKLFSQCLRDFTNMRDLQGTAETLHEMAIVHQAKGYLGQALKLYDKSLKIFQKIDDKAGVGGTYGQLGRLWEQHGSRRRAIRCYEMALRIFEEIGDKPHLELVKIDLQRAKQTGSEN
jgi:tetratricopeptide (TPR) repeat protein